MPGWNGTETAERIQAFDPTAKIIFITAYEDRNFVEARKRFGHSCEFLAKPVDERELYCLSRAFANQYVEEKEAAQVRLHQVIEQDRKQRVSGDTPPLKLLFVDDSPTVRVVYGELLRKTGSYEVMVASGMEEALATIERFTPDLCIIDYYMPNGNGDELIASMKERMHQKQLYNCLILVLTMAHEVEDKMLEVGAMEVLYKDEPHELFLKRVEVVKRYWHLQQQLERSIKSEAEAEARVELAQQEAQNQVEETHARMHAQWLESIIANIPCGLLILNESQEICHINQASKTLLQCSTSEIVGSELGSVFTEGVKEERVFCKRSGESIPVLVSSQPITLPDGKSGGSVVLLHDLRARQKQEEREQYLAFQAGVAEMSANILHNVGNTIQGMDVGLLGIDKAQVLLKDLQQLIAKHNDQVQSSASQEQIAALEEKQQRLMHYLPTALGEVHQSISPSVSELQQGAKHIKEIIRAQQRGVKIGAQEVEFSLNNLLDDLFLLSGKEIEQRGIQVEQ